MDYRKTFLRKHITKKLQPAESIELLAMEEILTKIEASKKFDAKGVYVDRRHPIVWSHVNLRQFFYRNLPGQRLFIPLLLKVDEDTKKLHSTDSNYFTRRQQLDDEKRKLDDQERIRLREQGAPMPPPLPPANPQQIKTYHGLSEILAAMHDEWKQDPYADQRGMLLISQSGGGKTASCWKAFYDCMFSTPVDGSESGQSIPFLNDFIPCWLPLDQSFEAEGKSIDVLQFLLNAAEQPTDSEKYRRALKRYLEQGPPLLIFADLNRVGPDRQYILAQAFINFQSEYGRYGHRIVITFRSTDASSSTMQDLKSGNFGVYNIVPLDIDEAKGYLINLRQYEQELENTILQQWGIRFTHRNVDEEQQLFEELAKKYLGRNVTRQESIISTPLLMHFFSILPPGTLDADTTLYQLYSAVIDQHLNREYTTYSSELSNYSNKPTEKGLSKKDVREQILIAMTRIALAIQSQGHDVTQLHRTRLEFILSHPDQNGGMFPAWWSEDSYWNNFRIMTMKFNRDKDEVYHNRMQIESILNYSLLRQNGESVGFLHDSMLYYFCGAVALVEPDIPTLVKPIDELWCQRVVRRIDEQPATWIYSAPFLASRLETIDRADNQLRNAIDPYQRLHLLLLHLIRYADSRAWLELLIRFTQHQREDDQLMKMIAWGLTASPGFLKKYPEQIPAELHRHLTLLQDKTELIGQFLLDLDEPA